MIERARSWATADLRGWCDHCRGARPLNYVATLRFDAPPLGLSHDLSQTGAMAQLLLAAGAPVNGNPGDHETPLMTAASHDDADVARVLIAAHAQLDALASAALLERRRRAGVDRLDEVWQMTRAGKKLPFYAERHVDEVLFVDPAQRTITWLALRAGEYKPVQRSGLIELGPAELAEQLDWP